VQTIAVVSVGSVSLGGCVKSLSDGVQTGGRSEGNMGNGVVSVGQSVGKLSISGPLAVVDTVVSVGSKALGRGVQSLGDGVQTGGGSKGNMGDNGVVSVGQGAVAIELIIIRPLALWVQTVPLVLSVGSVALGGRVKSLGDGVQTSGRSEGNMGGNGVVSVGQGVGKLSIGGSLAVVDTVVSIGSIALGRGVQSLGDGVQTGG